MNTSIEQEIKNQYSKFFEKYDWNIFKTTAEHYLENAAKVTTKDIKFEKESLKLLRRNVLKRLYIGLACELLLKSLYLKCGYCINKPKKKIKIEEKYPYKLSKANKTDYDITDTFTFNQLLESIDKVLDFGTSKSVVIKGFKIAKVFRNKEGHVAVLNHVYNPQNYRDIEACLVEFYKIVYKENLNIKFSVGKGEKSEFIIRINNNLLIKNDIAKI